MQAMAGEAGELSGFPTANGASAIARESIRITAVAWRQLTSLQSAVIDQACTDAALGCAAFGKTGESGSAITLHLYLASKSSETIVFRASLTDSAQAAFVPLAH
jgi:hypothetical protein